MFKVSVLISPQVKNNISVCLDCTNNRKRKITIIVMREIKEVIKEYRA